MPTPLSCGRKSVWHRAFTSTAQLGFQLLLICYMLHGLIHFNLSFSLCPSFSQLLILQNLWLLPHIFFLIIRVPLHIINASVLQFFCLFIYCNRKRVLLGLGNFPEKERRVCNQYLCHLTYWSSPWWLFYDSWDLALPYSLNVTDIDADSVNQAEYPKVTGAHPHPTQTAKLGLKRASIQAEKSSS